MSKIIRVVGEGDEALHYVEGGPEYKYLCEGCCHEHACALQCEQWPHGPKPVERWSDARKAEWLQKNITLETRGFVLDEDGWRRQRCSINPDQLIILAEVNVSKWSWEVLITNSSDDSAGLLAEGEDFSQALTQAVIAVAEGSES